MQGARAVVGGAAAGVDFVHDPYGVLPPEIPVDASTYAEEITAGLVAADLDADGHVDLLFPQMNGANRLYWGRGDGTFAAAEASGVELPDGVHQSASAADYDGDGLLDVVLLGVSTIALLRNRGDRTFEDVTGALGLSAPPGYAGGSAWADFDGDGDLDLFAEGYLVTFRYEEGVVETVPDALWRNDRDAFTNVVDEIPFVDGVGGATLHAAWHDFDDDGDPDLLKLSDFGVVDVYSSLWENQGGGRWVDRLDGSGLQGMPYPMGALITDLDEDGLDDLWVSNIGTAPAFRRSGPWEWVDVSLSWAAELPSDTAYQSWSVLELDLDGDGDPGVFINYGPLSLASEEEFGYEPEQADMYLAPTGAGPERRFRSRPEVFPAPETGVARGAAVVDLDGDGCPDLVVAHVAGPPSILLARCTRAARLVVALRDPSGANRFGVGAVVTVEAGGRARRGVVHAGGRGTFSGGTTDLYFGLGDAARVDRVTVRWPGGETEVFEGVCASCRVVLTRGG